MKKFIAILLLFPMTGCAVARFPKKHPVMTGFIAGAVAGGAIGYSQRRKFCHYTYDGKPYYGTTCPAPKD